MSDALGLSLIGQSFADNAVGAKAAYPIYCDKTLANSTVTLASVTVGSFTLAALYIPLIMVSNVHFSVIPFITMAPSMNAFTFPMYDATDGTLVSSENSGTYGTRIQIRSTTNSIAIAAAPVQGSANYVQVNGCIVILS